MTAEQVLNHVLPAMAGVSPRAVIKVEHHEELPGWVKAGVPLPPVPAAGEAWRGTESR